MIKELDKRKKARCTCDGSTRAGQVRVLDHTYANCVDQTGSRLFYAIATGENMMVFGADVSNAFAEAPAPKQGFYIRPDKAFREWWENHKNRPPIPKGYVIPVKSAMQGHPESPRLWEKHADAILRECGLTPTVHEPCLYSGIVNNERVLFKRQVDDFAVAAPSEATANVLFDMIDEKLTFPLKRMGLVTMFNGLDIHQTRDYVKVSVQTYIERICEKHLSSWMSVKDMPDRPTPLPTRANFMTSFLGAKGDPDEKAQANLAKKMGFGYRSGIGELIYAMITCRPDLSYATVAAAQNSACPAEIHYHGVRNILKYLYLTRTDGIYFWRTEPNTDLPYVEPPTINSNVHDLLLDGRPKHDALDLHSYMDATWASCLKTRRSFGGLNLRLLLVVPLLTRHGYRLQWHYHLQNRNSLVHLIVARFYYTSVVLCGTSAYLKVQQLLHMKITMHALPWQMLRNQQHVHAILTRGTMHFANGLNVISLNLNE